MAPPRAAEVGATAEGVVEGVVETAAGAATAEAAAAAVAVAAGVAAGVAVSVIAELAPAAAATGMPVVDEVAVLPADEAAAAAAGAAADGAATGADAAAADAGAAAMRDGAAAAAAEPSDDSPPALFEPFSSAHASCRVGSAGWRRCWVDTRSGESVAPRPRLLCVLPPVALAVDADGADTGRGLRPIGVTPGAEAAPAVPPPDAAVAGRGFWIGGRRG